MHVGQDHHNVGGIGRCAWTAPLDPEGLTAFPPRHIIRPDIAMAEQVTAQVAVRPRRRLAPLSIVLVALAALAGFALATPPGILNKADAVGYAICHRIASHSLTIAGRQLPLCARCTGIYLGALLGLTTLTAAGRQRASRLPPRRVLLTLIGFIALMGIDGLNSYLSLFPSLPYLYPPQNWLRLVTGVLYGLALAALIYPLFNSVIWREPEAMPSLRNARELVGLLLLASIVVALVLTENPALLYPLALLSTLGVVLMLSLVNSMLALAVSRRENVAANWRQAWPLFVAGVALTFIEIGLMDVVRFSFTGTWQGFNL